MLAWNVDERLSAGKAFEGLRKITEQVPMTEETEDLSIKHQLEPGSMRWLHPLRMVPFLQCDDFWRKIGHSLKPNNLAYINIVHPRAVIFDFDSATLEETSRDHSHGTLQRGLTSPLEDYRGMHT